MKLLQLQINEKLALAGTTAAFAWVMGLYFALQPMQLSGLPEFIAAGCLEWVSTILAVAAGLWCLRLLSQAVRSRGVAWWAYAIGIVAAAGTILVAVIVAYALISS
jgi:hypothetical protein